MKIIITLSHIRKTVSFKIFIFLSTIKLKFSFHFRGRMRLLLFNGVLFAQEIPKEWILLCMDYDVEIRLKAKSNKLYHCKNSRRYIKIDGHRPLDPSTRTSGEKIRSELNSHICFMNKRTWKADIAKITITWKNSYSRYLFLKTLHRRCLTRFWVCLRFWIFQGSD